jgi:hypothetical protein
METTVRAQDIVAILSYGVSAEYIHNNYLALTGGTLTGHLTLGDTVYDDMQFPSIRARLGANEKPDFDYDEIGLLFPQNNEAEYVLFAEQFSHSYKNGTSIYPHVHYIQDEPEVVQFMMQYRWYNNSDAVPSWTVIQTVGAVFPYVSGTTMMQMVTFLPISGAHINGVSSWFEGRLYRRVNDGVVGDVLVKSFDIHYEKDGVGSDEEYQK